MIYLDANATTRPSAAVIDAVLAVMAVPANPNSAHFVGAAARAALEAARDDVCRLLPGFTPDGIVFTSGGTEGSNAVIRGFGPSLTVTSNVEHPSVSRPAADAGAVRTAPVGGDGTVDPELVARAVSEAVRPLVSIQYANGETGVIQPIREIVERVRAVRPDAFIHTDAAQAVGRLELDLSGVDAVTFSGHKLHGPAGTGVLALADPGDERLRPLLLGGGQESGMRSGTQNVAGAVGIGVACRERSFALAEDCHRMRACRDEFERRLLRGVPGARVIAAGSARLPNTSNVMFPGVDGARLIAILDAAGVAASTGSACSSGRPEPSHVLRAMGLSEAEAYSCVRFSFSGESSRDDAVMGAVRVSAAVRELAR